MNKIVSKEHFSANVVKLEVEAPLIARSRKAGHFVIVKVGDKGERIPLTIAGADTEKGTITLVIQAVGGSSRKICELNEGDYITDVVGPLGQATHIEKVGTVVCAGGGVGVAPLLPIVEAFHKAGNRVIVVLAARTKDLVILEEQMRQNSDEVIIMTDDGSYGTKGFGDEWCGERDQPGEGGFMRYDRSGHYDEIRFRSYKEIRDSYRSFLEYDHGGRNGYVWCLPDHGRREDQVRLCGRTGVRCSSSGF